MDWFIFSPSKSSLVSDEEEDLLQLKTLKTLGLLPSRIDSLSGSPRSQHCEATIFAAVAARYILCRQQGMGPKLLEP
jgi:hypothetical protein